MCLCVCKRERERERGIILVCVYVRVCINCSWGLRLKYGGGIEWIRIEPLFVDIAYTEQR